MKNLIQKKVNIFLDSLLLYLNEQGIKYTNKEEINYILKLNLIYKTYRKIDFDFNGYCVTISIITHICMGEYYTHIDEYMYHVTFRNLISKNSWYETKINSGCDDYLIYRSTIITSFDELLSFMKFHFGVDDE